MRYWVYINDKVDGPYDEDKLVSLPGFTPDTLICSEEIEEGGSQEWVKASGVFEFDEELQATFSRKPLTAEELNTALHEPLNAPDNAMPHPAPLTINPAVATFNDISGLLLEKIDHLTLEIESLKEKLDYALASAHATQSAPQPQAAVHTEYEEPQEDLMGIHTITLTRKDMTAPLVQEEITNTESLVSQAESLVAQAGADEPMDFLPAMNLSDNNKVDEPKTETKTQTNHPHTQEIDLGAKGGEEVVLRSALDSLYGQKIQTEEEKEATFQDLLTLHPFAKQQIQSQAEKILDKALEQTQEHDVFAEPEQSTEQEEDVFAEPKQGTEPELDVLAKEQEAKREEIINEITAGQGKVDFLAQAIEEAKQAELTSNNQLNTLPPTEEPLSEPAAPAQTEPELPIMSLEETPAVPTQPAEDLVLPGAELPSMDDFELQPKAQEENNMPEPEKQDLNFDLDAQPELSIKELEPQEAVPSFEQAEPEAAPVYEAQQRTDAIASLATAEPSLQDAAPEEHTETIQELVPGKKLSDRPTNAPLSQADLIEAFTERQPVQEAPIFEQVSVSVQPNNQAETRPEGIESLQENTVQPAPTLPVQTPEPEQVEPINPNELTEVQLQEGSTYLISDFIPPAEAGGLPKELSGMKDVERKDLGGKVQGTSESIASVQEAQRGNVIFEGEAEEVIPSHQQDTNDLTVSKIILENTIKTKRGPGLDLKTVPMVKEPSQTERLDLSESELEDINAQHDLKMADIKSSTGTTKLVLGSAVALVILAAIYVILAFMNLIPANFNLIKPKPATTQEQQAQVEEMLGTDAADTTQQPFQQPMAQQPGQQPMQPTQQPGSAMPSGMMGSNQPGMQPGQMQPAVNPLKLIIGEVKAYPAGRGLTLQQLVESKHPGARNLIEWTISRAVEPDNYSILVKVPPDSAQSFKISYRFNYNAITRTLDPTISDSKNLLDSNR